MARVIWAAFVVCLLLLICVGASPAGAATPTPSATLKSIAPSQTSVYLYLHATPTNLTLVPLNITVDFQADPLLTADLTINMYRYFNKDHLIDIIGSIGLALFVVGLLIRFIGRTTKTNN
jgi:hypothetical protein